MARESIFTPREIKAGALLVALGLLLFAIGVSGLSFVTGPDAPGPALIDPAIAEAQPVAVQGG